MLHGVNCKRHQATGMPAAFQLCPGELELRQCLDLLLPAPPAAVIRLPRDTLRAQTAGLQLPPRNTGLYLRVIDAVGSERMVGLMPQRGTVLGGVVVGLRHVYDCFIIQGYCISIEGPVSAVYLVSKAKIHCVCVCRGQLCQQFESIHSNICN